MAFDKFLKQLFKKISHNRSVSGYSIGTLEKSIDLVFVTGEDVTDMNYLPEVLKQHLTHYIIEFKSDRDTYDVSDIAKTAMYKWGYCHNEKIHPRDYKNIKACLLVVKKHQLVEELIQSNILASTNIDGVYEMNDGTIQYLIIINELELKKENVGLLINASVPKIKNVLRYVRINDFLNDSDLNKYIKAKCFLIDSEGDEELMTEIDKILKEEQGRAIKHAVEIVGLDKIIAEVGIGKVIEEVGIGKVIEEAIQKDLVLNDDILNKLLELISKQKSIDREKLKQFLKNK